MAAEMFSWPSLHERVCRTWGSNSGPLACQANSLPIELPRPVMSCMNKHMIGKMTFLYKWFSTSNTLIRRLSSMKTHMSGKGAGHWEWHISRNTDIRFISGVNKHMLGKMTFLNKWFSTSNTTVWFIDCVNQHMLSYSRLHFERFSSDFTGLSPVWIRICLARLLFCENVRPLDMQLNCLCPVWISVWFVRDALCVNDILQFSQR